METNTILRPNNSTPVPAESRCTPDIRALQDTIYVIGGKWRIPIIKSICSGNIRFGEIEKSIPGITKRMLSRELKELELNAFIIRKAYPDIPMKAEYHFTSYAKTLVPLVNEMVRWGQEHRKMLISN